MSEAPQEHGPALNTDRELWRERPGDYYADSIHVTEGGGIGINCGGLVFVKPIREWHALAKAQQPPTPGDAVNVGVRVAAGAGDPQGLDAIREQRRAYEPFTPLTEDEVKRAVQAIQDAIGEWGSDRLHAQWARLVLDNTERNVRAVIEGAGDPQEDGQHEQLLRDARAYIATMELEASALIPRLVAALAGDRLRLGPAAPGPSAAGGAP